MNLSLTTAEKAILMGETGTPGDRMAMEIVVEAARMLGAADLVAISSSHIDGCLYHGDSGALFCEKLVEKQARVKVPTSTNVGALNLLQPDQCRLPPAERKMAFRLMVAHERLGCRPSWTCAPYQAGSRPAFGDQIAWGESNAVAFANTVLGARTNRYGDFLDIACAISGRAPNYGLHLPEHRRGRLLFDISRLPQNMRTKDPFYPVLGALVGRAGGDAIPVINGLNHKPSDDQLKALCAAAASTGAAALIHIVGVTPEAPDVTSAMQGAPPEETIHVTPEMIAEAYASLSLAADGPIDSVALGSPHFSAAECRQVLKLAGGQGFRVPFYICIGRHTLADLEADSAAADLRENGVEFVVDTCVVVTPILPPTPGVMMTNSAKFAHYATGNTGHLPIFASLEDCVASAQIGRVQRSGAPWL